MEHVLKYSGVEAIRVQLQKIFEVRDDQFARFVNYVGFRGCSHERDGSVVLVFDKSRFSVL
jgi:hypothetical protein